MELNQIAVRRIRLWGGHRLPTGARPVEAHAGRAEAPLEGRDIQGQLRTVRTHIEVGG